MYEEAAALKALQEEIGWHLSMRSDNIWLRKQWTCCDQQYCRFGSCPRTQEMLRSVYPPESVLARLRDRTAKEVAALARARI